MALRYSKKVSPSFSMSSMTDLIFLLLIFFVCTSTLVNPNALKLLLPQSNNQTSATRHTSVSIDRDLNYAIGVRYVPFEDLERQLQLELMEVADPTIALHVDRSVPMEEVVRVMNIAARNRFRLILATAPEGRR
jgi:biopolymer transport protein ExbD